MLTVGCKSITRTKPIHKIYQAQNEATCLQAKMEGLLYVLVAMAREAVSQLMAHDLSQYIPEGYVLGPETIDPFPPNDSL